MIIGIDYTAAAWQGAGIGRYTRELVRAAISLGGSFHYKLFYAAGGLPPDSPYLEDLRRLCATSPHVQAIPIRITPRLLTIIWQRLRLPLLVERFTGPLDILHAPDFALPPTHAPALLTIHDLTFLVQPECFEPAMRRYMGQVVPRSLRRASLVLVDSEASRADLMRLLKVPPERATVVYPGVDERFAPLPGSITEPVRQRLRLPAEFLLFVGTLEPRKNLVRLIEALHRLPDAPPLVIAGRKGWLYQAIFDTVERLHMHERVYFLKFVDDADLPALYNSASVFVYPSLYEGFGLPVAEALACGTPVVTANVASLPEVAGDAALLVNPLDTDAIAESITQALTRARDSQPSVPVEAPRFSWEASAYRLLDCYRAVGSGASSQH
jgi:glycosyltransferase involved in cell wall biosynthesis